MFRGSSSSFAPFPSVAQCPEKLCQRALDEAHHILFETWQPPRYYIPPEDVRTDLLVPSETKTVCPYKGVASYRSAQSNGAVERRSRRGSCLILPGGPVRRR